MSREEIIVKLTEIFCDVFDDEKIVIGNETVAGDIDGWDSLRHITLIASVEDEFGIRFAMKDVINMENVGQMIDLIFEQMG